MQKQVHIKTYFRCIYMSVENKEHKSLDFRIRHSDAFPVADGWLDVGTPPSPPPFHNLGPGHTGQSPLTAMQFEDIRIYMPF